MAFKDVLKKQRQSGSGLLSSVAGAAGAQVREAIDIRNILFTKDSLLGALFPNVRGFKAGGKMAKPSSLVSEKSPTSVDLSDAKLDTINQNTKVSAKNSMVLPSMARDMNVMRQNIVKLVKLSGGNASTSADMFFLKASEREQAYESQIQASKKLTTSPTPSTQDKSDKNTTGGILGLLAAIGASIIGVIGNIAKQIPETLQKIFSIATLKTLFGVTGSILTGLGRLLPLLISPTFLGIATAIAGAAWLAKWIYDKTNETKDAPPVVDELRETQKESNRITQAEAKNIKIGDKTANDLIREEQNLYELASKNPRMMTDSKKKESAARRTALESVGIFPLEVDDPSRPGKKELFFRREYNQDNIGGLDLPPEAPAAPAAPASPTPTPVPTDKLTPQQIERASTTPTAVSDSATTAAGNTTTKGLLDIIAKGESGAAGYNAMNQGGNKQTGIIGSGNSEKIIGKKLTEMTIGEILQRGKLPMRNQDRVFAAGRYQIIPDTLKGLVDQGVAKESDKFDETTQDKLGSALIEQTGALRLAQQGDFAEAQNKLAAVWGAIPSATTGTTALGGPNKADPKLASLVQSTLRASGTQIAAASAAVDSGRMQAMAPAPTTPVSTSAATPKTPSSQSQKITIPNTIDSDLFDALVARATEFS
jgi:muramidase (phage lysozyme)